MSVKDNLSIIVNAALAEGLSYGKYMVRYNYDPPCLKKPTESRSGAEKAKKSAGYKPKRAKTRICPQCGKEFETNRRRYCSTECQQAHKIEYDRMRSKRVNAAKREDGGVRSCQICGKQIPLSRDLRTVTCSSGCANELKSRRRMERYYELIGVKDQMLPRLYATEKNADLPHDLRRVHPGKG